MPNDYALVIDYEIQEALAEQLEQRRLRPAMISWKDNIGPTEFGAYSSFVVVSHRRAAALKRSVMAMTSGRTVFDFKSDVYPQLTVNQTFASPSVSIDLRQQPRVCFCIVCLPRSGSFLLCDIMGNAGLGRPTEHLRPPLIQFMEGRGDDDFDLRDWVANVAGATCRDGIVGTKIIFNFARRMLPLLKEAERDLLEAIIARTKFIHLFRSDKLMQAVSQYRAYETGLFRKRAVPATAGPSESKVPQVPYDFGKIAHHFSALNQQETELEKYLRTIEAEHIKIEYSSLTTDLSGNLGRISAFLQQPVSGEAQSGDVRLRDDQSLEFAERFENEYRELYGKELRRFYAPKAHE